MNQLLCINCSTFCSHIRLTKLMFYEAGNKVFRSTCVWPIEFVEEGQTVLWVTILSDWEETSRETSQWSVPHIHHQTPTWERKRREKKHVCIIMLMFSNIKKTMNNSGSIKSILTIMDSVVHSTMKPPVIIIYLVLVPSAQIYLKITWYFC